MRLWHKNLIRVLPRQQLLSQWRECCAIAKKLAETGKPGHILVNKITDYPKWHFMTYTLKVIKECERRGYRIDRYKFFKWFNQWQDGTVKHEPCDLLLFSDWHNDNYLTQCWFNLMEKHDCGAISDEDWLIIYNEV